ncbi:MAG: hypothetical protein QNK37_19700 [Acidobacteriota bacterium]|nr:hypothetical protein [Acidobacteriota bacterium]
MIGVFYSFLTKETVTQAEISRFFELIGKNLGDFLPERLGTREPLTKIDPDRPLLDQVDWSGSVYWKKRKGKVSGSFSQGTRRGHARFYHMFQTRKEDLEVLLDFLVSFSSLLRVDFSSLHFEPMKTTMYNPLCRVTTGTLRQGLPGVPFGFCLGEAYIDLIGKEKLQSLPAYETKMLSDQLMFIRSVEKRPVTEAEEDAFRTETENIKSCIGSDYFPKDGGAIIPEFEFKKP